MVTFAPDFIREVRARTNLVALVAASVRLEVDSRGTRGTALCPFHAEKTPSFTVVRSQGFYHCFGCSAHGDCFAWLEHAEGYSFPEAVERLATEAGMIAGRDAGPRKQLAPVYAPPPDAEIERRRRDQVRARCLDLWRAARPAAGTVVEVYWLSRGLALPIPPTIRYLPDHEYREIDRATGGKRVVGVFPVMLALMSHARRLTTVHRTYLRQDGLAKAPVPSAKKLAGPPGRGAVWLTPPMPVTVLGEGIETSWAVRARVGERVGAAAGYSIGHIAGKGVGRGEPYPEKPGRFLPSVVPDMDNPGLLLPDVIEEIVLLRDADSKDMASIDAQLARAAERFIRLGKRARIMTPPDGLDFADWNLALRRSA